MLVASWTFAAQMLICWNSNLHWSAHCGLKCFLVGVSPNTLYLITAVLILRKFQMFTTPASKWTHSNIHSIFGWCKILFNFFLSKMPLKEHVQASISSLMSLFLWSLELFDFFFRYDLLHNSHLNLGGLNELFKVAQVRWGIFVAFHLS